MEGAFCVVTGANSGIGKEVTAGLLQQGAHVVMACRSNPKCEEARQELLARSGMPCATGRCECLQVDVSDFGSIRCFSGALSRRLQEARRPLQVLVNNAGLMGGPELDVEGRDRCMVTNHYGPFLLTNLLLPLMARGGRIVNVGSRAHFQGSLQFDSQGNVTGSPWHWYLGYARSKLCNTLFTLELQRRLAVSKADITAYCVSPGRVNTNLFTGITGPLGWALAPLVSALYQTPQQGAQTVLYAATSPDLAGRNELYLHDMRTVTASATGRDVALAGRLWEASERFVGMQAAERAQQLLPPTP